MSRIEIFQNADLQRHNSLAVPAKAAYLTAVHSIDEITQALAHAQQNRLALLVLGEGSNTVLSSDFPGLVILNQLQGIEIIAETDDSIDLKVAAGENWHALVAYTVERGWVGLENLALIPGLVGAAPIQNIGAYGVEVKDTIVAVDCVCRVTGECISYSNSDCKFAYRDSIFKHALIDQVVITSVHFKLLKNGVCNLTYPALAAEVGEDKGPSKIFQAVCAIRTRKLPHPQDIPNAGSFFKNPVVSAEQHALLRRTFPDLVSFPYAASFKLAAAWIIDTAEWKKKSFKGVHVHGEQALVICNPQNRDGKTVLTFAKMIQQDILQRFGVELEIEPRIV